MYDPTAYHDRDDLDEPFQSLPEFRPTQKPERALLAFQILRYEERTGQSIYQASLADRAEVWYLFLAVCKLALASVAMDPPRMIQWSEQALDAHRSKSRRN